MILPTAEQQADVIVTTTDDLRPEQITPAMQDSINEQKKDRKFIFQLIGCEDGKRSEPIVTSWDQLREALSSDNFDQDDFILLVAALDGKDTIAPATPIITIKRLLAFTEQ